MTRPQFEAQRRVLKVAYRLAVESWLAGDVGADKRLQEAHERLALLDRLEAATTARKARR